MSKKRLQGDGLNIGRLSPPVLFNTNYSAGNLSPFGGFFAIVVAARLASSLSRKVKASQGMELASNRHPSASIRRFGGNVVHRRLQTYPSLHVPLHGCQVLGMRFFD